MKHYDFHAKGMNTKKFESIFVTDFGTDLWEFMQTPLVVRSLLIATHLNKAPVATISDLLLERFGISDTTLSPRARVKKGFETTYDLSVIQHNFDRIKQYIGVLVKVILYHHDCVVSSRNASANDPLKIFTSSARYKNESFLKLKATAS